MDIKKIRQIHPSINRCELRMQYSSRKTEPYWLAADLYLFSGDERRKTIFLGAGSKADSEEAIRLLFSQGYTKTGARLNQEWYHISFVRDQSDQSKD